MWILGKLYHHPVIIQLQGELHLQDTHSICLRLPSWNLSMWIGCIIIVQVYYFIENWILVEFTLEWRTSWQVYCSLAIYRMLLCPIVVYLVRIAVICSPTIQYRWCQQCVLSVSEWGALFLSSGVCSIVLNGFISCFSSTLILHVHTVPLLCMDSSLIN